LYLPVAAFVIAQANGVTTISVVDGVSIVALFAALFYTVAANLIGFAFVVAAIAIFRVPIITLFEFWATLCIAAGKTRAHVTTGVITRTARIRITVIATLKLRTDHIISAEPACSRTTAILIATSACVGKPIIARL